MKKLLTIGLACAAFSSFAQFPEAIKLTEREQFEKAAAAFEAILKTAPNNGEAWFYLGENQYANGLYDSAAAAYTKGMEVNPSFALNYAGMGKVLRVKAKDEQGKQLLEKAVEMADLKANRYSKRQKADTYREVAEAWLAGEHPAFQKALDLIDQAIKLNPDDPKLYILKGDALFERNPRDGSAPLENYKLAMERDPLNAKPVARKGFMYYRAQNFKAAIDEYSNAIALDPDYAPAYRGRAEAYFRDRDFDKATADMNKYLELNRGNVSARVRNAQFLFLVEKYDESLAEIEALEQEGVHRMVLKRMKAFDLFEKGELIAAQEAMQAYFDEQPESEVISVDLEYAGKIDQALAEMYQARLEAGDTTRMALVPYDSLAAELYLKAARMDRTKGYLYIEAAKAFVEAGDLDKAVDAMREKVEAPHPEVNDWYYLGSMANRAKQYLTADSAWAQYIAKQPNIYQGYLNRARAQAGMDTAKVRSWLALPYYREVLRRIDPDDPQLRKSDLEEAYNYMGLYYLYDQEHQDLPVAKCWFMKVSDLDAGTSITAQVNGIFLKMKELENVEPAGSCGPDQHPDLSRQPK